MATEIITQLDSGQTITMVGPGLVKLHAAKTVIVTQALASSQPLVAASGVHIGLGAALPAFGPLLGFAALALGAICFVTEVSKWNGKKQVASKCLPGEAPTIQTTIQPPKEASVTPL
ncbi:MAG: hypothetical protein H7832_13245 [Magnetococcus sp. DMHC-6]